MLAAFVPTATALCRIDNPDGSALPEEAVWIDLVKPTAGEDQLIEKLIGVEIPTREEMQLMPPTLIASIYGMNSRTRRTSSIRSAIRWRCSRWCCPMCSSNGNGGSR